LCLVAKASSVNTLFRWRANHFVAIVPFDDEWSEDDQDEWLATVSQFHPDVCTLWNGTTNKKYRDSEAARKRAALKAPVEVDLDATNSDQDEEDDDNFDPSLLLEIVMTPPVLKKIKETVAPEVTEDDDDFLHVTETQEADAAFNTTREFGGEYKAGVHPGMTPWSEKLEAKEAMTILEEVAPRDVLMDVPPGYHADLFFVSDDTFAKSRQADAQTQAENAFRQSGGQPVTIKGTTFPDVDALAQYLLGKMRFRRPDR
jgi:hypothetical protein